MSQKGIERPTLQGQRIKTRKRDEKEKFDPTTFRDQIFSSLNESNDGDLELIHKNLDQSGSKLDYRKYGEQLFDILIVGGLLAPGGSIIQDPDPNKQSKADFCLFNRSGDDESIKAFAHTIVTKLTRRYKYLEKTLEESLGKIIGFQKAFDPEDRVKLAKLTAILISGGQVPAQVISNLNKDTLIKEGIAVEFLIEVLRTWHGEKDAATIWTLLRKASLDSKLLALYPPTKRTQEHLTESFQNAGLGQLLDFQKIQLNQVVKRGLQNKLTKLINENASVKELIALVKDSVNKSQIADTEVSVLLWNTIMDSVEWSKKEELVAEQALKYLKGYAGLMQEFTKSSKAQLALMIRIQEYCYENMIFLKVFHKIILLFYKADVLSEDVILKWYNTSHSPKGKNVFLDQLKKFVEWLQNAEEESDNDN